MKSGRCTNENVLEWAYKKRLIARLPPKKPPQRKEMEKAQPRTSPVTPSEIAVQRQRARRPDKQLYVPRARRSDASSGDETTQSNEKLHVISSPTSAKTVLDQKLSNSRVHLNAVENRKSVQESHRRTTTCEALKRTLRNEVPKNLPDVVPVEKKICDKERRNSTANRISSASDSKPCDLVNVKTDIKKHIDRISSARSTIARKEDVPVCEKNLQKSSPSIKSSAVSCVTPARKSSLNDSTATNLPLEGKVSVESVSSLRTTIESNISERRFEQKPSSSIKVGDQSAVERTRTFCLNSQKERRPVEQIRNDRELIDSVAFIENVSKTQEFCERIDVQISPAYLKSSDNDHKYTLNSSLNCHKSQKFQLVSVNAEDEESSNSKHKHIEFQKNELSIENPDIIYDELPPCDTKPSEVYLDAEDLVDHEVYLDAEDLVGHVYLNHEIQTNLSENKGDQDSNVDSHLESILSEIPLKEMKLNDLINHQLCKNDMKLSCSKSHTTADSENLQQTCSGGEEGCTLPVPVTLVNEDVCDTSTTNASGSHIDNLSLVQNSYMIPSQVANEMANIAYEPPVIENSNLNTEELCRSYSSESLQTTLGKEMLVNVEIDINLSTDHDDHVENSFLIKPSAKHELEENRNELEQSKDSSESTVPSDQHFDEDLLRLENSLDQTKMDGDSWDSLFDENGDCLNPTVMTELTDTLGKVDIQKSKYDYLEFRPQDPDLSGEEFSHIVELYDFPAEFKTQDLMSTLSTFRERGFNIKWIDDTHALAVFSSSIAATEALSIQHPLVKVRPLSQAISGSKWKAKRFSDDLLPYKPRPQTTASLARRLVSGALGLRVSISKEQRDQERQRLQQAKDRKRQVAKQKQDVWDGAVK